MDFFSKSVISQYSWYTKTKKNCQAVYARGSIKPLCVLKSTVELNYGKPVVFAKDYPTQQHFDDAVASGELIPWTPRKR